MRMLVIAAALVDTVAVHVWSCSSKLLEADDSDAAVVDAPSKSDCLIGTCRCTCSCLAFTRICLCRSFRPCHPPRSCLASLLPCFCSPPGQWLLPGRSFRNNAYRGPLPCHHRGLPHVPSILLALHIVFSPPVVSSSWLSRRRHPVVAIPLVSCMYHTYKAGGGVSEADTPAPSMLPRGSPWSPNLPWVCNHFRLDHPVWPVGQQSSYWH